MGRGWIMRNRTGSSLLVVLLLLGAGLPMYQLYTFFRGDARADTTYLLFEVAQFQMELLDSFMNEAEGFKETRQLDPVKLSAYSANFAHQRLIVATRQQAPPLSGLDKLVDFINGLQIGGQRSLREDERALLQAASGPVHRLYLAYGQLLDAKGRVVSARQAELVQGNQQLELVFSKKAK